MRARNIKPGFFKNEDIADIEPIDRLFFIGMWCAADREGRLVDRPKRIKMDVMPCDNYDAETGIHRLTELGFLNRYTVNGKSVIQIVNFLKHQSPHSLEKDSELPDKNGCITVHERKNGRVCSAKKQFIEPMQEDEEQLYNSSITNNTVLDNIPDVLDLPDSLDSKAKSKPFVAPKPRPSKKAPDDFSITPEMSGWATVNGITNIDRETESFMDHTFATAKTDWEATWRNWMRRANRDKPKQFAKPPALGVADRIWQNHLDNQQKRIAP